MELLSDWASRIAGFADDYEGEFYQLISDPEAIKSYFKDNCETAQVGGKLLNVFLQYLFLLDYSTFSDPPTSMQVRPHLPLLLRNSTCSLQTSWSPESYLGGIAKR